MVHTGPILVHQGSTWVEPIARHNPTQSSGERLRAREHPARRRVNPTQNIRGCRRPSRRDDAVLQGPRSAAPPAPSPAAHADAATSRARVTCVPRRRRASSVRCCADQGEPPQDSVLKAISREQPTFFLPRSVQQPNTLSETIPLI
jgi:hypothetical protein